MTEQDDLEEQELDDPRRKRVVYTPPAMKKATVSKDIVYKTVEEVDLKLDVYYPPDRQKQTRLPAVILIHGDGTDENLRDIKNSGQYVSWGQLIAAAGLIAVTANHRSSAGLHNAAGVANDIDDLISYVRDNSAALHINEDVLCIWTCSAGAPFGLRAALYENPLYIRCIVCYYGFTQLKAYYDALYSEQSDESPLLPPAFSEEDFDEFSASDLLQRRQGEIPPLFVARAGLDYPELNETLDSFVAEAIAQNVQLDFMNHPTGQHAFDLLDDDPRSHEIIKATLEFLQVNLLSLQRSK